MGSQADIKQLCSNVRGAPVGRRRRRQPGKQFKLNFRRDGGSLGELATSYLLFSISPLCFKKKKSHGGQLSESVCVQRRGKTALIRRLSSPLLQDIVSHERGMIEGGGGVEDSGERKLLSAAVRGGDIMEHN